MRRNGGDATLLGLRSDIDLAWQALQEFDLTADKETITGSRSRFVHEVRLAAVRSSLAALSSIPVALVVRAVQTGLWSVEHALAMTADRPVVQHLEVCIGLLDLSDLNDHDRRKVQRVSRDIVVRSGEELSARVLIALFRRMDPSAEAEAVRARLQARAEKVDVDIGGARRALGWERDPTQNSIEPDEVIDVLAALSPGRRAPLLARATGAVLTALRPPPPPPRQADDPEDPDAVPFAGYMKDMLRGLAEDTRADLSGAEWLMRNLAPYMNEHPDPSAFGADLAELLADGSAPGLARATVEAAADHLDRQTLTRLTSLAQSAAPDREPSDGADFGRMAGATIRAERRKMYPRRGPWERATDLETADLAVSEVRERLTDMAAAATGVVSPGRDRPGLEDTIRRIAVFAALPRYVARMSAEELSSVVGAAFAQRLLLAEYDAVDGIDGVEADLSPEGISARRVVRGELLCVALGHAVDKAQPLVDAWQAIPPGRISLADLAPVLVYLRTLPLETTRHQLNSPMFTEHYDEYTPPLRLQALRLAAPYLSGADCEQLLTELEENGDPRLRLEALIIFAPRLGADALADVLSVLPQYADALELSWALEVLTPDDAELRKEVNSWRLAAISNITGGARMGEALAQWATDGGEPAWRSDLVHQILASSPPNRRLDALVALGSRLEQELDEQTARLILELPAVDDTGRYSWRAVGITTLAPQLPPAVIPDAWTSARELPMRMRIGSSEAFGWHWSYEFARAAAMHALIPRLPEAMLRGALRDAQELSWTPRRAVLTALAERADADLAGDLLDSVLDRAMRYAVMPDPGPSRLIEGVEVFEPMAMFKIRREVDTAELVAALAPRLDREHLTRAVRYLPEFTNDGPRSWLPGQLVPYLDGALLAEVLPRAVTSAMAFVIEDPTRLDLLTSLLPHLREMLDEKVAPIRDLVHRYFPSRRDFLLDKADREVMTQEDRAAYEGFIATYHPDDVSLPTESADMYAFVESMVRNPLFIGSIETVLAQSLWSVPLRLRIDAMPQIAEFLPDDLVRPFVDETAANVFNLADHEMETAVELLDELLPFTGPEQHRRALEIARAMPGPNPVDLAAVGRTVYRSVARGLSQLVPASRSAEPTSPGMQIRDQSIWNSDLVDEVKGLAGPRSWLLLALARRAPAGIRADAFNVLLDCSDAELVHAIPVVMPVEEPGLRSRLIARTVGLQAGFARAWVLWQLADALTPAEIEVVESAAHEAARAIADPLGRAVAWLTLANLRTEAGKLPYLREAVAAVAMIKDRIHLTWALSGVVVVANGDASAIEHALAMVLDLSPGTVRAQAITIVADAHPDLGSLPDGLTTRLREACCMELRQAAGQGRAEFLTALANLPRQWLRGMPDRHRFEAAQAVHEVCTTYHWF